MRTTALNSASWLSVSFNWITFRTNSNTCSRRWHSSSSTARKVIKWFTENLELSFFTFCTTKWFTDIKMSIHCHTWMIKTTLKITIIKVRVIYYTIGQKTCIITQQFIFTLYINCNTVLGFFFYKLINRNVSYEQTNFVL